MRTTAEPPALGTSSSTTVITTAEHTIVTVNGDIDLTVTDRLRDQLTTELELRPDALVVDLSGVDFCSTRGLSILVETSSNAHAAGIPCAIVIRRRAVLRGIERVHLDHVLQIHRTLPDALDWLSIVARVSGAGPSIAG